jgi:hypothetical protein
MLSDIRFASTLEHYVSGNLRLGSLHYSIWLDVLARFDTCKTSAELANATLRASLFIAQLLDGGEIMCDCAAELRAAARLAADDSPTPKAESI